MLSRSHDIPPPTVGKGLRNCVQLGSWCNILTKLLQQLQLQLGLARQKRFMAWARKSGVDWSCHSWFANVR